MISWFNQTFYTNDQFYGGTGPTAFYGAVAYDPALQEMVYFGGCSYQCPSNQTWVYDQYGWANVTLEIAGDVPAAYGMSMAWDPQFNAVIMVGGVSAGDVVDNSTWGFYGTEWFNWTQFVGAPAAFVGYNGTAFASMAWDGALQSMILVDGCALANCTIVWTGTWELTDDGGWGVIGAGPFDFLWGASMGVRPHQSGDGCTLGVSTSTTVPLPTGTYILNSTGWWNITTSSRECIYILGCIYLYPSARGYGSMTWDGQINAIVMVGGDGPAGSLNDTWYFYNGTWEASDFFGSIPGPLAGWGGAMDPNSSVVAPALVGGICYQFCENDTWVLEIPPSPSFVGITPSPADTQFVVNVSVSNLKGDGSGPVETVLLFDSGPNYVISDETDVNFTTAAYTAYANFSYTEPGTYTVYAEIGDFFDVYSFVTTTLRRGPVDRACAVGGREPHRGRRRGRVHGGGDPWYRRLHLRLELRGRLSDIGGRRPHPHLCRRRDVHRHPERHRLDRFLEPDDVHRDRRPEAHRDRGPEQGRHGPGGCGDVHRDARGRIRVVCLVRLDLWRLRHGDRRERQPHVRGHGNLYGGRNGHRLARVHGGSHHLGHHQPGSDRGDLGEHALSNDHHLGELHRDPDRRNPDVHLRLDVR